MIVTLCSFFTAVLCCSALISISFIFKNHRILVKNNLFSLSGILCICFLRMIFLFELPVAAVIRSKNIMPSTLQFFQYSFFEVFHVSITISLLLVFVWACGSIILIFKLISQIIKHSKETQRLISQSHPKAEQLAANIIYKEKPKQKYSLIVSNAVETPMIKGFLKPTIYLPHLPFTDEDLENILNHEWIHFSRKDIWVKSFVYIMWALLWWIPPLYFLKKDFDRMLEVSCDLRYTSNMSEDECVAYLTSLLNIERQLLSARKNKNAPMNAVQFLGSKKGKDIKWRFKVVLGYKRKPSKIKNCIVALGMAAILISSYSFVIQPYGTPPAMDMVGHMEISPDNACIIVRDGRYLLYIDGKYSVDIDENKLTDEPHSSLPLIYE